MPRKETLLSESLVSVVGENCASDDRSSHITDVQLLDILVLQGGGERYERYG
jgi:hypothetical protein